jgi:hypothetical protein
MSNSRGLSIILGLALSVLAVQGNSIPTVRGDGLANFQTAPLTQIAPDTSRLTLVATASIPDSGSTIILLGFGLIGLAVVARKFFHSGG